ncbi:hypothetical protein [Flavobacterium ajazii]|uniref:hypothetical protein n=1 Tax=Flavobacterium ajazii TaxID=2692318 RepID=UPI0013D11DA8|nr:hypothetical protein [Flavobacterium ajazii]
MIVKLNNTEIFLTWENYKKLHEKALFEKDDDSENYAYWLMKSLRKNSEEYKEKIALYIKALKQISVESKEEFKLKWLHFKLTEKEAKDNCWNILNDFCIENKEFFLLDNRTFEESLVNDYLGESYTEYPIGKKFSIIHVNYKKNYWWSPLKVEKKIEIIIDTNNVLEIRGSFKKFEIITNNCSLGFENKDRIKIIV